MRLHHERDGLALWHGPAAGASSALAAGSVQSVVTSPPYWGLRDYGTPGQLGAEYDVNDYVANLVFTLGEVRKVLADDGVLWLNLGDSYANDTKWGGTTGGKHATGVHGTAVGRLKRQSHAPAKSLVGVPWRVALACIDDGWTLRTDVVWEKANPMPEPVKDRPTRSHEFLFMLTKGPRYYFDRDAIAEPAVSTAPSGNGYARPEQIVRDGRGAGPWQPSPGKTRNGRDVWRFPSQPFSGAHFAVFPPELPRRCIRAASRPGDLVLDPFSGSGTTGMVALQEGRRYVGIDSNAEYLNLSLSTRFAL